MHEEAHTIWLFSSSAASSQVLGICKLTVDRMQSFGKLTVFQKHVCNQGSGAMLLAMYVGRYVGR